MTNKEAIEILTKTDRVGVNLIFANDEEITKYNQDNAEALHVAIKAIEVVEKIKESFITNTVGDALTFDIASSRCYINTTYHILCEAYGTEENRESWMKEYEE